MTKKLAIISSYGDSCGNASYTEALRKEFAKHYDVTILKLNVSLLNHPTSHDLADEHIRKMAEKLSAFDYVNIQFEVGLFGPPKKVMNRFKMLANASPNLIVTLHRYDSKVPLNIRAIVANLIKLQIKKAAAHVNSVLIANDFAQLYHDIVSYCRDNNKAILVHTPRDKDFLQENYNYTKIYDHPLTFLSQDEVKQHQKKVDKDSFKKKYRLEKNDVTIGIFGFISPHKGYITALKAMLYLPDNYKLLIFGSQHPLSIRQHEEVNPYLHHIMSHIEVDVHEKIKNKSSSKNLFQKVKFCGALDDDGFIQALLSCDMTILPYVEVNQGGSGVASLTLDTGIPSIFSQNLAFLELEKYAPKAFKKFSIGNHLELANAIENYNSQEFSEGLKAYTKKFNMESNIKFHRDIFEKNIS